MSRGSVITVAGRAVEWLIDHSVIMADNLVTILDLEIDRAIGQFPLMESVDEALSKALGLEEYTLLG